MSASSPSAVNLWDTADHVASYLARADKLPHRSEGERALLDVVPVSARRVLDLGTGNGRLVGLLKARGQDVVAVAVDFSPAMVDLAQRRFADDEAVEVLTHDLEQPLDRSWGRFDAVVSSFAIHHVGDERKRALYAEVFDLLAPE